MDCKDVYLSCSLESGRDTRLRPKHLDLLDTEPLRTVVDSRLNVIGVRNLRIVDASIMPIILRGNIITTVYAVAERAADIVGEDLGLYRYT
jgi:hypothetical protein